MTFPIGEVTPVTPVTMTVAVTDCPRVIGLGGESVSVDTVGAALFTVRLLSVLVEAEASEEPM